MNSLTIAIFSVAGIGIVCAIILSVASKVMAVHVDERIQKIRDILPGVNCGGCGFAGCDGYAEALTKDKKMEVTLCNPGGPDVAQGIAEILGRKAGSMMAMTAMVHCMGDCNTTKNKMDYRGIESCAAANLTFGGVGYCSYGCMGMGDCARACPKDAICFENGIAHINSHLCVGCGACVRTCPKGIISMVPYEAKVKIRCSNKEKGAVVRKECNVGCIGCGMCAKKCPTHAITVENNLATIDYDKCVGCGMCKGVCPSKCIIDWFR